MATILSVGGWMVADLVQAQTSERSGEQVVKQQCIKCHGTGVNGAPKIDDRAAWAPRMSHGLQATVASAARGHGKMPARGGLADLTDGELRAAILYMFYPAVATMAGAPAPAAAEPADPHRKLADGLEVFLGISPAGKGSYRINISLRDAASKLPVGDAVVEARVESLLGGSTKTLQAKTFGSGSGYVNDFRMADSERYTITAQIRRKGETRSTEVKFDFRP